MRKFISKFDIVLIGLGLATGANLLAGGNNLGIYIILGLILIMPSLR